MAKKKALIKSSVLTDASKVAILLGKNKIANGMSDTIETVYHNNIMEVRERDMGGWKWAYASRKNDANPVHIIAKEKTSGKYLLVLQPRAPIKGKKLVLSFPAGMMDKEGETPIDTAIREMREETGFDPEKIELYAKPSPKSAGFITESAVVITCEINGSAKNEPKNDPDEDIYCLWMSVGEFWKLYPNLADDIAVEYDLFMFMLAKKK